jgi:hypothetical protein
MVAPLDEMATLTPLVGSVSVHSSTPPAAHMDTPVVAVAAAAAAAAATSADAASAAVVACATDRRAR